MGLMSEYINKRLSAADLESELLKLISKYNELRQTFALVYAAAIDELPPINRSR
ncbi:MAG: hypothetical protein MUP73_05950 [Dehalococcoidia bacterium]|nr:hypothetical protein [Dehalococcoidia bacterium]